MSTFHARVDAAQFHEALGNVLHFSAKRSSLPILAEANVCLQNGALRPDLHQFESVVHSCDPGVWGLLLLCICRNTENLHRLQILFGRVGAYLHR